MDTSSRKVEDEKNGKKITSLLFALCTFPKGDRHESSENIAARSKYQRKVGDGAGPAAGL